MEIVVFSILFLYTDYESVSMKFEFAPKCSARWKNRDFRSIVARLMERRWGCMGQFQFQSGRLCEIDLENEMELFGNDYVV